MHRLSMAVVVGLVQLPAGTLQAQQASAIDRELQGALERWSTEADHYGVSASVILADGTQWSGAAGKAGEERLRPGHLILIASITKTMTGALILKLAEAGRLSLEDSVSKWLPPTPNVAPTITIRQLLNHTSGVANYTDSPSLRSALDADPVRVFSAEELLTYIGPPRFAPGERTQYTNTAFVLLGQIAQRVTGESIDHLYRTWLWEPLGLTEIFLPGRMKPAGPIAKALAADGGVIAPLDHMGLLTIGNSAFGVMATAATVARWGRALFAGTVVSPAMQAEMRTLVPAAGNIRGESGAGLGIRSYHYLGRTQYGHSGGSRIGSSLLIFDPESGVTVAVTMNQGRGADHFVLAPELLRIAVAKERSR